MAPLSCSLEHQHHVWCFNPSHWDSCRWPTSPRCLWCWRCLSSCACACFFCHTTKAVWINVPVMSKQPFQFPTILSLSLALGSLRSAFLKHCPPLVIITYGSVPTSQPLIHSFCWLFSLCLATKLQRSPGSRLSFHPCAPSHGDANHWDGLIAPYLKWLPNPSQETNLSAFASHTEKLARNPPGNVSRKPQSEHAQIQIHHYLHQNFASDTSDPNCCLGSLPRICVVQAEQSLTLPCITNRCHWVSLPLTLALHILWVHPV